MKTRIQKIFLLVVISGSALLSSCVPMDTSYTGSSYTRSYGSSYYDEPVFVETRPVTYLPVGASYVYEYGEPHWYHNGVCYRKSSHGGYVIVEKRHSDHHSRPPQHVQQKTTYVKTYPQPSLNRENRYIKVDDHHDHDGLIHKNGHYYKKGPHGQLILVK